MGRVILARGPVVEALRRYDPGLRVRWSWEKQKWAVDAPYKFEERDPKVFRKPPVRYERIETANGDMWAEHLLPELSERMIEYRDRRYAVCYVGHLDWRLLGAVAGRDSHRFGNRRMVGQLDAQLEAQGREKQRADARRREERVYEGWDRFRFGRRKLGPGAEDGTGVSIKGAFA